MISVTVRQLEYFLAIVSTGSLGAASRELHVSPSSLSAAMSELERSLGVQLLVRQRAKRAVLTSVGRELFAEAKAVVDGAARLESAAGSVRDELVGTLSVGCFDTLAPWVIPALLEHFAGEHPGVDVVVREGSPDELQRQLELGDLDAAFMYHLQVHTDVEVAQIAPARPFLVLPAGHRLQDHAEVFFADLADERAVLLGLDPSPDLVTGMMKSAGFAPVVRWRLRNVETVRSVVARGLAFGVLMAQPGAATTYDGGHVVYKRIADVLPQNSIDLVHPLGGRASAKVRALRSFAIGLQDELGSMIRAASGPG